MTYCVAIRNDVNEYYDSNARWLWDGSMWHHNVPDLTDARWERAPSYALSDEVLFRDVHHMDWRVLVKVMVDQAAVVLMVPSARRGTRWELQYLKTKQLLEQTIFIKPAYFSDSDWVETRRGLWDDLIVPEYRKGGYLFTAAKGSGDTFQAQWQEIAEYKDDLGSVRNAMYALRPELMTSLTRMSTRH
jgi:hypothetical protein